MPGYRTLAAGDLSGIYGERKRADPGGVSGRGAIGSRVTANAALPGNQLPVDLRTNAAAPPLTASAPAATEQGGGLLIEAGSFLAGVAGAVRDWWSSPAPLAIGNPAFKHEFCALGQQPPCPWQVMKLNENTPFAAKITDFVDYGEVDGTVFRSPRWWEFWKENKQLSSDEIRQGGIGDCFLLAALAAIAHKEPETLRKMIKQHKKSKTFWVNFYELTSQEPVLVGPVNNEFPVFKKGVKQGTKDLGGQSAFAKPVGDPPPPIWPLIVEKAYAIKFRKGSYGDLNQGGHSDEAMTHITGRPSRWILVDPNDSQATPVDFKDLAKWDADGQPITVATKAKPAAGCAGATTGPTATTTDSVCSDPLYDAEVCKNGAADPVCQAPSGQAPKIVELATGHAYWIKKIDPATETVTLANPWGSDRPTVEWPWSRLQKSLNSVQVNEKK